jgi:LacI family transcriptional regulator
MLPTGTRGKSRLSDVAARAGVSLGTASRAMSMPEAVRAPTLAKVRAAAEELGYTPHLAARALASGRSQTLGLLVPTLVNPIYAAFVQAAQRTADLRGLQLLVTSDEYERKRGPEHVRRFVERGVDGVILIGADHDPGVFAALKRGGTPHVFAWSYDEARGRGSVGISNGRAVWQVVRHLTDLGHRRFAVLSGDPQYNERARSRLDGIRTLPITHKSSFA